MQLRQQRVRQVVMVETYAQLINPHYYNRQWIAARNLNIPRRPWLDVIADTIYNFDGKIINPNGTPWPIPDVDEVMGGDRWISAYLEIGADGNPRRFTRKIERLRLFNLHFSIKHPNIHRHFGR